MSATQHPLRLTGLDAQDPLGYLAALGCLLATSDHCTRTEKPEPTMSFEPGARLIPSLHGPHEDIESLVRALVEDLERIAGRGPDQEPRDPFLAFSYEDDKGKAVHDLKPPPDEFRRFAKALLAPPPPLDRRSLDWASATLTDVATDNSGAAKPFALHFTAGQQRFLTIALELLDGAKSKPKPSERRVDLDDIRAALLGPWPNDRDLKVFSYSPTQDRAYALRAVDPSGDKKLGTPGADWLALRGIGLLSSAPIGDQIHTSGVRGGWKTGTFSYPIWPMKLDADALRSLLRHPAIAEDSARNKSTLPLGVEILRCTISRSEQGGYGAFSRPSRR